MAEQQNDLAIVGVSLDCADHIQLAAFYAALLGGSVLWTTDSASAARAGAATLIAQRVDRYQSPRWPGASIVHLDIGGPDLDLVTSTAFALAHGATLAATQPDPRWVVLLDPAGHPFCLTPFKP